VAKVTAWSWLTKFANWTWCSGKKFATCIWWHLDLVVEKILCNLDFVTNVRHLDLVALGFVCGKDLLPGFSGKCLFPGFGRKSLLPALGGKIFRYRDLVAFGFCTGKK
jgi:hypothetical protein